MTSPPLQPRPLGSTGLTVSPVGLGTVKFGRNTGVKYPAPFDLPSDDVARALLQTAQTLGVTLIDTAPAYGTSEVRLGELLPQVAPRDHWTICTKAGEEFDGTHSRFDFSPAALAASVQRSLSRLRISTIDLLLVHCGDDDVQCLRQASTADWRSPLVAAGQVRCFGASVKTVAGARLALDQGYQALMVSLNQSDTSMRPVIEYTAARGAGILIKKGLGAGRSALDGPAGIRAAVQFALRESGVSLLIVGTLSPLHLREIVEAAAGL